MIIINYNHATHGIDNSINNSLIETKEITYWKVLTSFSGPSKEITVFLSNSLFLLTTVIWRVMTNSDHSKATPCTIRKLLTIIYMGGVEVSNWLYHDIGKEIKLLCVFDGNFDRCLDKYNCFMHVWCFYLKVSLCNRFCGFGQLFSVFSLTWFWTQYEAKGQDN